jgi:hypothetical protein
LTYFLDLTGLDWHQYLGVAVGLFLLVHFIGHMEWISQVSARFLRKLSVKVRIYYLLDMTLLAAILVITVSGVAISTWLEIGYGLYPFLRDLHIISSIAGLVLLLIKLVLHWKVIAHIVKGIQLSGFKKRNAITDSATAIPVQSLSRRDALKTIGAISALGIFGLYKAASAMVLPAAGNALADPQVRTAVAAGSGTEPPLDPAEDLGLPEATPEESQNTSEGGQRRRRGQRTAQDSITPTTIAPEQDPQVTPQLTATPMPVTPVQDCVIRCPRGCAYPGQCRRYIDNNSNQLCDLGECLPV